MGSLAQVLRDMPASKDPNFLVGPEGFDDAGVYRLREDLALVQTVDFFPPLVDDPLAFGRIAAANSLSDIYAMGAQPLTCLNIVGFPDKDLPMDVLVDILRGGYEKVHEAGAVIAGGHSVRDSEIKYGLAVTGTVDPRRIVRNDGARPGDRLVLTKPLGSGILTTAAKKGALASNELDEAIAVMVALNASAAQAMLASGARAATDITGFGLIGHAFSMAQASAVTVEIDTQAVPLLPRTPDLAGAGHLTRAAASTLEHVGPALERGRVPDVMTQVLADAQTSGGLLISVPGERCAELTDRLRAARCLAAAVIGRVLEPQRHRIKLI
jgi:selenide,water dikinase